MTHAAITPPSFSCWLLGQTGIVPPMLCRSSGEGLKHSWAHVQPHYTTAAMGKALEEAMACGEALSNPWNLKVIWGLQLGLLACPMDRCHRETAPVRAHMLPSALAGARPLHTPVTLHQWMSRMRCRHGVYLDQRFMH